jgi:hypothetical protein
VGRALVQVAARLVREGGFCALDWTTDSLNLPARRLYDGIGARVVQRTYYRIESAGLEGLLVDQPPGAAPLSDEAGGG